MTETSDTSATEPTGDDPAATHLLVVGGSAGIGRATVTRALDAGMRVRAMSRDPSDLDIEDPKLDTFAGDATDAGAIADALDGVTAVAVTLGVPLTPATVANGTKLFSKATETLIGAMETRGIDRLVAVTGVGSGDSWGALSAVEKLGFRAVFGRIYADKTRQDEAIRASGLAWTIARPTILTNGGPGSYQVLVEPRTWRNGIVSRTKVADFIVTAIRDGTHVRQAPVLVG